MKSYKATIFDLDDTLLNRDQAVDKMFSIILETCYGDVEHSTENKMLKMFKEHDKRDYGNSDKSKVFESLFDEFPPKHTIPNDDIRDFWNSHFPECFSVDESTLNIVNTIKMHVKVAIATNGSTHRQKAKIATTNLNDCFDTIIISESRVNGYYEITCFCSEWWCAEWVMMFASTVLLLCLSCLAPEHRINHLRILPYVVRAYPEC